MTNINEQETRTEKSEERPARLQRFFTHLSSPGLILLILIVGGYLALRVVISTPGPAQVKFVETQQLGREKFPSSALSEIGFSGKAMVTAQRFREAAALGMAVSLAAFATYAANRTFSPTELGVLKDLSDRRLTPPGIDINGESIESELSVIRFRYRREPFGFEIVSVPRDPAGPLLLLRFPLPPGEPNSVTYFQSLNAQRERLPAVFSTTEQLSAAGWNIGHWRGEALSLDDSAIRELQEQDEWLRSMK